MATTSNGDIPRVRVRIGGASGKRMNRNQYSHQRFSGNCPVHGNVLEW